MRVYSRGAKTRVFVSAQSVSGFTKSTRSGDWEKQNRGCSAAAKCSRCSRSFPLAWEVTGASAPKYKYRPVSTVIATGTGLRYTHRTASSPLTQTRILTQPSPHCVDCEPARTQHSLVWLHCKRNAQSPKNTSTPSSGRSGPRCSDLRLRCSHARLHDCSTGCVVSRVVDGWTPLTDVSCAQGGALVALCSLYSRVPSRPRLRASPQRAQAKGLALVDRHCRLGVIAQPRELDLARVAHEQRR